MLHPGETYLGDGLYASFDGYQFKLRAPRSEGDHEVYLEWDVYLAFRHFVESVWTKLKDDAKAAEGG